MVDITAGVQISYGLMSPPCEREEKREISAAGIQFSREMRMAVRGEDCRQKRRECKLRIVL